MKNQKNDIILLTIGPVTTATRFARLLKAHCGMRVSVTQTPSCLNSGGCSYSVIIQERSLEQAKEISGIYGIKIRKIYRRNGGDHYALY